MEGVRYVASVCVNDVSVFDGFGNDLNQLIIGLITEVDSQNTETYGKIFDKNTGKVVYQCRKAVCE